MTAPADIARIPAAAVMTAPAADIARTAFEAEIRGMLITAVAPVAAEVARRAQRHWLDAVPSGDGLSTGAAAIITGFSDVTLRTWAEECAAADKAIGLRVVTGSDRDGWVLSWTRLLDEIERRKGKPRRVEAECQFKKFVSNLAVPKK